MSKEVDERVVSMQFDNKHFERNVQTTMSTLDKLKAKLHLPGAAKGLQEVDAAARKVDLSPMAKAAETVGLKFNAMYTIADQALRNITNSAMAAGKRIVSALTIDPVKTGFSEYELKMDSVKTIMASTGESIEKVNELLEELNTYSDQTIYSFSDMTQNIGKFTNAGVKLEDAVLAIKGISNEAALSGANANEASRAMYNFAQALSVGYIQRIDWKSIELANMATVEFKEQLLNAAVAAGTVKQSADGMYATLENPDKAYNAAAMFTETLDDQWLTTEVLINTLKDYSDATTDIGKRAFAAAQDVTKLSQMFDILKETAQSGWAKTWELIFGDLETAKSIFTPLTEFFSKLISGMNEARNAVLEGALGKTFKALMEPLKGLKQTIETISEPIQTVTKSLEDYNRVVKEVIRGDWGQTQKRWNALTEAGYDWKTVQNMVNEELGCSLRRTTDFTFGQSTMAKSTEDAAEANNKYIASLAKMSDEELRALKLEEDQIEAIKQIRREADKLGMTVEEFLGNIDKLDGRWVVLEGFKNIGKALGKVFKTVSQAWKEIFPPKSTEEKANALYDLLAAFHKFSKSLIMSDDTANKLRRTLKGVFAIIDIITTIAGGAFKMAFKVVRSVLGAFNLDILDVTAIIGDALVGFRDFVDGLLDFGGVIKKIVPWLKDVGGAFADWVKGIKEADNIPKYIIQGLVNGLTSGVKSVVNAVLNLGKTILETIKDVLGIHSPSREMYEVGTNVSQGLFNGIKDGVSMVWELIKTVGLKIIDIIKNLDIGMVIAAGITTGITVAVLKISNALESFAKPFESLGNLFDSASQLLEDFGAGLKSVLKASALEKKGKAILSMAIALGIMVGAVYLLTKIDTGELWAAIGALAALAVILGALAFAASKMGTIQKIGTQALGLLAIGAALYILAKAMEKLASIDGGDIPGVLVLFTGMITGLAGLIAVFGLLGVTGADRSINKVGGMLVKVSMALLIMIGVIKLAGMLDKDEVAKGMIVIAAAESMFFSLIAVSLISGKNASKAGSMLLKVSMALLIMVGVIKLAGMLDKKEIGKGLLVVGVLGIFCGALTAVSIMAGKNASKAGSMLLKISAAMLIMVGVIKLAGMLNEDELGQGLLVVGALSAFCSALIFMSLAAGEHASKAGTMLLKISVALAILTGVMIVIGELDPSKLGRALGVVAALEILFMGLIGITHFAKDGGDIQKVLMTLTLSVALIALALAGLSFIDPARLGVATAALATVMTIFAGLIAVTKFVGDAAGIQKTLLVLVGTIALLAGIIVALSFLNPDSAIASATSLSILLTALSASMIILSKASRVSAKDVGMLALMGLVVAELAVILAVLDKFNVSVSMNTVLGLSTLLTAMSGALAIVAAVGKLAGGKAFVGIGALVTFIAALAAVFAALGGINELTNGGFADILDQAVIIMGKLGEALGAIVGGLMIKLSEDMVIVGENLGKFMDKAKPFFDGLANCMDSATAEAALSLAAVILAITAANVINGVTSFLFGAPDMNSFAAQLIPFGKAMVEFSSIVAGNIDSEAVTAAANAGKAMAEMNKDLPKSGGVVQWFVGETMSMEEFGKQLVPFGKAMVAFSSIVAGNIDAEAVTAAANAGKAMAEMNKDLPKTGGVVQWFVGETMDMKTFGEQLVPFGEAMVKFSTALTEGKGINPEAITAAATAGKTLAEMASALPSEGGWVDKIAGTTMSMKDFGDDLEPFAASMVKFSTALTEGKGIDPEAITAAADAGKTLAEMASALPSENGWIDKITGTTKSMTEFGDDLEPFAASMVAFSKALTADGGFDPEAVDGAAESATALSELANNLPEDWAGIDGLFGGTTMSMKDFGVQLEAFGSSMVAFSKAITADGGFDPEAITAATTCGEALVAMNNALPKTGGLKQFFSGEEDMANFSNDIVAFGKAMRLFSNVLTTSVDYAAFDAGLTEKAVKIGEGIIELCALFGSSQGALTFVAGGSIMEMFAAGVKHLAIGIRDFCTEIVNIDFDAAGNGILTGRRLLEMLNNFPSGDTIPFIFTEAGDMVGLSDRLLAFGKAVNGFAAEMKGVDQSSISNGVVAGKSVIGMIEDMPEGNLGDYLLGVMTFKTRLETFAQALVNFDNSISGVDPSEMATTIANLKSVMSTLGDIGDLGVSEFASSFKDSSPKVTEAITAMLDAAVETANNQKLRIEETGASLASNFVTGFASKKDAAKTAAQSVVAGVTSGIGLDSLYTGFYNAGTYLVSGFVEGISDNAYKARLTAAAMAKAAEDAVRKVLDINSPSKVFRSIGGSVPEGFAKGIDKLSYMVTDSTAMMGNNAINGIKNSISRISDAINGDIDSQPTIRPVMDLSDVTSGVGTLNSMLGGMTPSVDVMANIKSIGSMMNMSQNGGNGDVVSAINDLKKSLGNISGNTYNVNGITYDDGSNITAAVKSLVHAARIERRI